MATFKNGKFLKIKFYIKIKFWKYSDIIRIFVFDTFSVRQINRYFENCTNIVDKTMQCGIGDAQANKYATTRFYNQNLYETWILYAKVKLLIKRNKMRIIHYWQIFFFYTYEKLNEITKKYFSKILNRSLQSGDVVRNKF